MNVVDNNSNMTQKLAALAASGKNYTQFIFLIPLLFSGIW